jgi:hypothetical protein
MNEESGFDFQAGKNFSLLHRIHVDFGVNSVYIPTANELFLRG